MKILQGPFGTIIFQSESLISSKLGSLNIEALRMELKGIYGKKL